MTGPGALAHLAFDSTSGDLHCTAPAASLRARSTSGDLSLQGVGNVSANTTSGNVRVQGCDASLGLTSTSGDISIDRYIGADLAADCTSGDVTVNYGPDAYPHGSCRIRTVSGDIRTSGPLPSTAQISTVSGRHRHR